jgi:hypothetical protein
MSGRDPTALLKSIWEYPLLGEAEASWAVKESQILLGNLASAREQPSLGVSIITTELGTIAFGDSVEGRIDRCISWALARAETEAPYRLLAEVRDPIGFGTLQIKPDLRHTLAFAIILLRAGREHGRTDGYVSLALRSQQEDGGWLPADPKSDSAVFTTLYGLECLLLADRNPVIIDRGLKLTDARTDAFGWLEKERDSAGLWSTGVFRDRPWDRIIATGWVLHRLSAFPEDLPQNVHSYLHKATDSLVRLATSSQTWAGIPEAQRFRLESRAAGAVGRIARANLLPEHLLEASQRYLSAWNAALPSLFNRLRPEDVDVSTATFAVWACSSVAEMRKAGRSIS